MKFLVKNLAEQTQILSVSCRDSTVNKYIHEVRCQI